MAITDPRAIRFVNEQVRPMAEKMRAILAEYDAMQVAWNGEIAALIPADDKEAVEDGREGEGVSRLNGLNIHSFMTVIGAMASEKNTEIIAKPCVRALSAS